jgi:YggT family protein
MLIKITLYLIDVVAGFFVYMLLTRFYMQWLRVPFRNPLGVFIIAVTNWMVAPARRVIPSAGGLDLASLLLAFVVQVLGQWAKLAVLGVEPNPLPLLAIAATGLLRFSLHILVFCVIVQAIMSWFSPYNDLTPVFGGMTRPFLAPIRRFLPPLGGIDLSPLVLLVVLQILFFPLEELQKLAAGLGA